MGLVGFLKTALLNPFQWWNLRGTGWINTRTAATSTTGRDRAVNISWIAVVIGISSAFYFFYQFVQTIIGRTLQRIGNNIVDTQLPGDDDDLKPPPGWKPQAPDSNLPNETEAGAEAAAGTKVSDETSTSASQSQKADKPENHSTDHDELLEEPVIVGGLPGAFDAAYSSALNDARDQSWSFGDI